MQVKVFEADDMTTALKKIKATLGPEAIILSTKTVKKRGLGVFGAPTVEVTAAIDEAGQVLPARKPNPLASRLDRPQKIRTDDDLTYDELRRSPASVPAPADDGLAREVAELKQILSRQEQTATPEVGALRQEIDQLKSLIQGLTPPAPASTPIVAPSLPLAEPQNERPSAIVELLTEHGVQPQVAKTIARYVQAQPGGQDLAEHQVRPTVRQTVQTLIQVGTDVTLPSEGQRRVALVGPTGVGKTTTVAKLAAAAMSQAGQRVALITIDTYRIAAVEQLNVYGDIMNLPVEVVLTPDEMDQALARHRDKDLILIDTAGRSPRDTGRIEELGQFLGGDRKIDTCLVMSANTRDAELQKTVERFGQLSPTGIVFTKLDECETFGALLNTLVRTSLPLTCLTNGQRVPEDLLQPVPEQIAAMILPVDEERP